MFWSWCYLRFSVLWMKHSKFLQPIFMEYVFKFIDFIIIFILSSSDFLWTISILLKMWIELYTVFHVWSHQWRLECSCTFVYDLPLMQGRTSSSCLRRLTHVHFANGYTQVIFRYGISKPLFSHLVCVSYFFLFKCKTLYFSLLKGILFLSSQSSNLSKVCCNLI